MMRPKWSERGRGRSVKRRLGPWLHSVEAKCTLAFFLGCLVLFLMFSASSAPQRYSLTVGAISHQTITATKDVVRHELVQQIVQAYDAYYGKEKEKDQ